jgi:hypothetical protein
MQFAPHPSPPISFTGRLSVTPSKHHSHSLPNSLPDSYIQSQNLMALLHTKGPRKSTVSADPQLKPAVFNADAEFMNSGSNSMIFMTDGHSGSSQNLNTAANMHLSQANLAFAHQHHSQTILGNQSLAPQPGFNPQIQMRNNQTENTQQFDLRTSQAHPPAQISQNRARSSSTTSTHLPARASINTVPHMSMTSTIPVMPNAKPDTHSQTLMLKSMLGLK